MFLCMSVVNLNNDIAHNSPFWFKLAQNFKNGFSMKVVGQVHALVQAAICKG